MSKISKPTALISIALALIFIAALAINSCKTLRVSGDTVVIQNPKDTTALGRKDHFISKDLIDKYKEAFAAQRRNVAEKIPTLSLPQSEAFNKRSLLSLLRQPDCTGIRIYHGIKSDGKIDELRLILVGVNSKGDDILIDKESIIAADITQTRGGLEQGQCPSCQVPDR